MTEDKTTITDNEVIARFMDIMIFKTYAECEAFPIEKLKPWSLPEQLTYHTSWEKLMPVWYKFKDLNIEDRRKNIVFERFYLRIKDAILHQGCSEACKLLAEGIRWYNSTTQNKENSINQTVKK